MTTAASRSGSFCDLFWVVFRMVLGGVAVLVEAPKTCQYYFFKFIKNVGVCGGGMDAASKQILQSVRPLHPEHYSRFAVCHSEAAAKAGAKRSSQGVAVSSPTGRRLQG